VTRSIRGVLVAALACIAWSAQAQPPPAHGPAPRGAQHFDARFNHNHYYPMHGAYVRELPHAPVVINRGSSSFFYSGGVWYRPRGPHFVVVPAPIGVFVPVLPAFYTTLWVGGLPYYYANDTYYTWNAAQSGYEVVAPPSEEQASTQPPPASEQQASTPPPPSDELFVYPQNGQSEEQQASDKYECHRWAAAQSGFDPTQSGGGVPPEQAGEARDNYQRATRACLEGRGYSVR